jgi:predicted transcriptional regulator of viral defense system
VADAAKTLNLDRNRARRFLAYLAARGWLARVQPGLYVAVPLEASEPADWREDPWVVAASLFAPCYIGGWSACEHWGLTDQIFRDVMVVSGSWTRNRSPTIQGTKYRVKVISPERLFGTRVVWRGRVRVEVSDPSRTVLDLLDDPELGGGIRHVADVLTEWFAGEHRDDQRLLDYAERLGNRSVYKRLGFLVDRLGISAPELLAKCEQLMSTGVVRLDPSGPDRGRRVKRWNLIANVAITAGSE